MCNTLEEKIRSIYQNKWLIESLLLNDTNISLTTETIEEISNNLKKLKELNENFDKLSDEEFIFKSDCLRQSIKKIESEYLKEMTSAYNIFKKENKKLTEILDL